MAHLNITPVTQNLSAIRFSGGNESLPSPSKLIPRNPDGTVKDCSAVSGLSLTVYQSLPQGGYGLTGTVTPTIDVADATGVTCHFAVGDADTMITALGANGNYPYVMTATAGSDSFTIAQGVMVVKYLN
jgi:hypothetical protein